MDQTVHNNSEAIQLFSKLYDCSKLPSDTESEDSDTSEEQSSDNAKFSDASDTGITEDVNDPSLDIVEVSDISDIDIDDDDDDPSYSPDIVKTEDASNTDITNNIDGPSDFPYIAKISDISYTGINNDVDPSTSIAKISDISESDITDDDGTFEPCSSTSHIVTWIKKGKVQKSLPDFTDRSGPSDEMLALSHPTPIAIFFSLISVSMMEHIVHQTNLYATQSGKPFTPFTLGELYTFLGLNLLMGIKKMPSYRDYWSVVEMLHDEFISSKMPIKRFSWILGNLHLNDKTQQPEKGYKEFDKLYRVRPFLSHLKKRFMSVLLPTKNQAIDESMIKFKGKSCMKHYTPKKPIKKGYKVWLRCNQNGFVSEFDIYTRKTEEVEKYLGQEVVKKLTKCLHGKNHHIFMDSFFTTYELFHFLKSKNLYACGTVMPNQRNLPKTLNLDRNMKRGEVDWAVSEDDIICLKWKDRKCVSILSSFPDATHLIQLHKKENGRTVKIKCPKAVSMYNKNIGFVDNFNQLKSMYEIDRKSKKWWHRIFFYFIDVTVINSYILHKMLTQNQIKSAKEFRLELIYALCAVGKSGIAVKRHLSLNPKKSPRYKVRVSEEKRFSNVEHIPRKSKSRRCAYCSTTKEPHRTTFECETCGVGLCFFRKGVTCFQKYHMQET